MKLEQENNVSEEEEEEVKAPVKEDYLPSKFADLTEFKKVKMPGVHK